MRSKILVALLVSPLMVGCATLAQDAYDEQAEQECYEIMNAEAQRACLNELETEQLGRD
jgi:aryl-alcohol dehydrogenase-like predicted oxidoreductase